MKSVSTTEIDPSVLRAARYAPLNMMALSDTAREVTKSLSQETYAHEFQNGTRQRKATKAAIDSFQQTIGALIADLLTATLNEEAEGYCYRSSNISGFRESKASSRQYQCLLNNWPAMGLLEVVNGIRGTDDWEGEKYHPDTSSFNWATRLRATPKLLNLLADHGISSTNLGLHFIADATKHLPVILRGEKKAGSKRGEMLRIEKTDKANKIESDVREINSFLGQWNFSFGPAPLLTRIFNDGDLHEFDWNFGGRLYGPEYSYLNWSPLLRKDITIEGSPVNEIDVSACQLTLFYGLSGEPLDLTTDPYSIDGLPRDEVKKMVNLIIGNGKLPSEGGRWDQSIKSKSAENQILDVHPILKGLHKSKLTSTRLQAVESDILVDTLLALKREHGIPALPIHDCIIVRSDDIEVARSVYSGAFQIRAGITPRLSIS